MNFQKAWNKTFTKACRENLKVKIMTDKYIERVTNRIFGVNGFEFYEIF